MQKAKEHTNTSSSILMTSNMSGLASLALAIDRLDQQEQSSPTTVQTTSFVETTVPKKPSPPHAWDSGATTRIPQKQSYYQQTARTVSVGSLETDHHQYHQVSPTATAVMAPRPPEEAVEIVFDNSAENPPPSPPAPEEVIDTVQDDDVLCGE